MIILLLTPLTGCASFDDLAMGDYGENLDPWVTVAPDATDTVRYTEPVLMSPLKGDEIVTSDESFKPFVFSSTLGSNFYKTQRDLHKVNLISLLTNTASRGSIAPWESSIEPGLQLPSTSTWLASLEAEYEPNQFVEADSEQFSMSALAMSWIDDADSNNGLLAVAASQNQSGMSMPGFSTGVIASTTVSSYSWGEIISTSLRWIAMLFLAVVLLIPAGCSYAARLVVGTRSRSSPQLGRRRSSDCTSSIISRAIANVATH